MPSSGKQITLRNVSPELVQQLMALARARGSSVNAVILALLEEALGVDKRLQRLQERYATWSQADFDEFQEALQAQRTVDEELWR